MIEQYKDYPGLDEVEFECERIKEKWGEQDHPDISPAARFQPVRAVMERYHIPTSGEAKEWCEFRRDEGTMSWSDILIEELCEAVEEAAGGDEGKLRSELVQVAAVAVQWINAIDRRKVQG